MAIAGGLLLLRADGGIPLLVIGALILMTVFLEPRYRKALPGPMGLGWQQTSERFHDNESGEWLEVWFNPETGERCYVLIASEQDVRKP
ncbi:MAG: hypothetical protein ABIM50_08245 [Novosphingobium sp.]